MTPVKLSLRWVSKVPIIAKVKALKVAIIETPNKGPIRLFGVGHKGNVRIIIDRSDEAVAIEFDVGRFPIAKAQVNLTCV